MGDYNEYTTLTNNIYNINNINTTIIEDNSLSTPVTIINLPPFYYYDNSSDDDNNTVVVYNYIGVNVTVNSMGVEMPSSPLRHLLSIADCTTVFRDAVLYISCEHDTHFTITKDGFSFMGVTSDRIYRLVVPDKATMKSGDLVISYFNDNGELIGVDFVSVTGVVTCKAADCIFCAEAFSTFSCQPPSIKYFLVLGMILFMAFFLACMGWFFYLFFFAISAISGLWSVTKVFFKILWKLSKKGYVKVSAVATAAGASATRLAESEEGVPNSAAAEPGAPEIVISEEARPARSGAIGGGARFGTKLFLFAMICGIASGQGCVGGITVNSQTSVCTRNLTSETCAVTFDLLVSLPFSHSQACFAIKNTDNSSVVGQLNISYVEQIHEITLETLYWSSDWVGRGWSNRWCWTTGNWCGSRCDHMNASDPTGGGRISDIVTTYPGITGCARTCGCAGCGCFYCDDACLLWRWALITAKPRYSIRSPLSERYKVLMNMNSTAQGSRGIDFTATPGAVYSDGGFNFQFVGSFPPASQGIGVKKIRVKEDGTTSFVDACPKNAPCRSLPGDVQAAAAADFDIPSKRILMPINRDIATVNVGSRSVGFTFSATGYSVPGIPLPGNFNSKMWSRVGDVLKANETQSSPVLFSVSTTTPMTFTRFLDVVCPNFEILSVSGCFSCPIGFNVNISVNSDCLPGPAMVVVNDAAITLGTGVLTLTRTTVNQVITLFSAQQSGQFSLCLGTGEQQSCKPVTYSLLVWDDINDEGNANSTSRSGSSSGWDGFSDFWKTKLYGSILAGFGTTNGVLIFTLVFAYLIFVLIGKLGSSKVKQG
jgi:hypothetical protein